ncbi:PTS system transporter subunit IIA [Streptococcus pneumoniae]|nr:PTS system transporter subunit IIA [Streptococcus pneumoniae]
MEYICFQLIANSGAAKSSFIEAIQLAKAGNLKEAKIKVEEAEDSLVEAHKIHSNLIQKEATGEKIGFSLLFQYRFSSLDFLKRADSSLGASHDFFISTVL